MTNWKYKRRKTLVVCGLLLGVMSTITWACLTPDCGDCETWNGSACVSDCASGEVCCNGTCQECCDDEDCAACEVCDGEGDCTCVVVEYITGLSAQYAVGDSAEVMAILSENLPSGCSIEWGGDATFSNISGYTATATFNSVGSGKQITAKTSCQDEATGSDLFDVLAYKVEFATQPMIVCRHLQTYTVNLTDDSFTNGETEWDSGGLVVIPTLESEKSMTFSPSQTPLGSYTITASAGGLSDTLSIKNTAHQMSVSDSDSFTISPEITGAQVKTLADLATFTFTITKKMSEIETAVNDLLTENRVAMLAYHQKYQIPTGFDEWVLEQGLAMISSVQTQIDAKIAEAKAEINTKVDDFCAQVASRVNQSLAVNVDAESEYHYNCDSFNPGQPGWDAVEVMFPKTSGFAVSLNFGFDADASVSPLGVGLSKIPIKGLVLLTASCSLDTYNTSTPSPKNMKDTSANVTVNAKCKVGAGIAAQALVVVEVSFSRDFNYPFPTQAINLTATEASCPGATPQ